MIDGHERFIRENAVASKHIKVDKYVIPKASNDL